MKRGLGATAEPELGLSDNSLQIANIRRANGFDAVVLQLLAQVLVGASAKCTLTVPMSPGMTA